MEVRPERFAADSLGKPYWREWEQTQWADKAVGPVKAVHGAGRKLTGSQVRLLKQDSTP